MAMPIDELDQQRGVRRLEAEALLLIARRRR
jgi:hypothetical protein